VGGRSSAHRPPMSLIEGMAESEQKDIIFMSRFEIDSKHCSSGASRKKGKNNIDSGTNEVVFMPEKPPAKSTYDSHIKKLNKRIADSANIKPDYNNFDRLKLCIDLRLYGTQIEFKNITLIDNENPDKEKSYVETQIENNRLIKGIMSNSRQEFISVLSSDDTVQVDDEDELSDDYQSEEVEEIIPVRKGSNVYPNCGIPQKYLPTGLNAIYIKNDYFIMDISGKWMADVGYLGFINIHNIAKCLIKVCECGYVSFNIAKAIDVTTVRICDVTLDITTEHQSKFIRGMSAMSPIIASNYRTINYKNNGLIIRSTAKDVGMSFTMYNKGRELDDRRHNYYSYLNTIGNEGLELAHKTLRLEIHLWRLGDIRDILEIPDNEKYEVALSDVLRSKAPAVLNILSKYRLTEEILRDEIKGFTDKYLSPPQTEEEVTELLAGIGMMAIFEKQALNHRNTRDFLAVEFMLEDDEKLLKKLNRTMRNAFHNFIFYCRPKCIKRVLDLLDLIHGAYGRNCDENNNDDLLEAA